MNSDNQPTTAADTERIDWLERNLGHILIDHLTDVGGPLRRAIDATRGALVERDGEWMTPTAADVPTRAQVFAAIEAGDHKLAATADAIQALYAPYLAPCPQPAGLPSEEDDEGYTPAPIATAADVQEAWAEAHRNVMSERDIAVARVSALEAERDRAEAALFEQMKVRDEINESLRKAKDAAEADAAGLREFAEMSRSCLAGMLDGSIIMGTPRKGRSFWDSWLVEADKALATPTGSALLAERDALKAEVAEIRAAYSATKVLNGNIFALRAQVERMRAGIDMALRVFRNILRLGTADDYDIARVIEDIEDAAALAPTSTPTKEALHETISFKEPAASDPEGAATEWEEFDGAPGVPLLLGEQWFTMGTWWTNYNADHGPTKLGERYRRPLAAKVEPAQQPPLGRVWVEVGQPHRRGDEGGNDGEWIAGDLCQDPFTWHRAAPLAETGNRLSEAPGHEEPVWTEDGTLRNADKVDPEIAHLAAELAALKDQLTAAQQRAEAGEADTRRLDLLEKTRPRSIDHIDKLGGIRAAIDAATGGAA